MLIFFCLVLTVDFFKKCNRNLKDNYRAVSIIPNLPKLFEHCIFRQISNFIDPFYSKFQCGFRQGCSIQNYLPSILEKWKAVVEKGQSFGALLTDLSKAFDCFSHELLLAKLHVSCISISA